MTATTNLHWYCPGPSIRRRQSDIEFLFDLSHHSRRRGESSSPSFGFDAHPNHSTVALPLNNLCSTLPTSTSLARSESSYASTINSSTDTSMKSYNYLVGACLMRQLIFVLTSALRRWISESCTLPYQN